MQKGTSPRPQHPADDAADAGYNGSSVCDCNSHSLQACHPIPCHIRRHPGLRRHDPTTLALNQVATTREPNRPARLTTPLTMILYALLHKNIVFNDDNDILTAQPTPTEFQIPLHFSSPLELRCKVCDSETTSI